MTSEKFLVTCESCGGSDELTIVNGQVNYKEHTPIISARHRPDLNWGFECTCGQDSRVAPQEKDKLHILVKNGTEDMIKAIATSLTPNNELKFRMERI